MTEPFDAKARIAEVIRRQREGTPLEEENDRLRQERDELQAKFERLGKAGEAYHAEQRGQIATLRLMCEEREAELMRLRADLATREAELHATRWLVLEIETSYLAFTDEHFGQWMASQAKRINEIRKAALGVAGGDT